MVKERLEGVEMSEKKYKVTFYPKGGGVVDEGEMAIEEIFDGYQKNLEELKKEFFGTPYPMTQHSNAPRLERYEK